jgi:two-component system sensor histidine kinase KdpD
MTTATTTHQTHAVDATPRPETRRRPRGAGRTRTSDWRGYAWAAAVTAIATAVGWPLHHQFGLGNTNVLMLYLLGVLWVATRHSRGAAIGASVLSVAAFNFYFVPPHLTLAVADHQYLVTFAVMLLTALTISTLTHRVREQAGAARQAWERAEAEFLRNTLLSGVSHDLRTPLSAITGAASTLIETGDNLAPAARTEMLDTIYSETARMERLINNLLDMTRLESGGLRLRKEWHSLHEVLGAALQHVEGRLRGREVRTDLPADLPLVRMDGVAIEQVLVNLLDNAAEYVPATSPIEISVSLLDPDPGAADAGGELAVEVADRGPGLPVGAEQRVFQKFFGAGAGSSRRGLGLGLAICRGIVEAHGGRIVAANRPGGGAAFRFTLPRSEMPPAAAPAESTVTGA